MRSRSKALLALAAAALSAGVVTSSAVAHGGHRENLGKISKKGSNALKVEVRGAIKTLTPPTATTPGSITLTAAGTTTPAPAGFEWTCSIPPGSDVSAFAVGTRVKAKCRSAADTGLTLTRMRHKDKGDKVKVEARGTVDAYTAAAGTTPGSITVNTGVTGQAPVTCAVTDRTRLRDTPVVGSTVKVECKSKDGVLTAKKIKTQVAKVKARGTLVINADGSVTVGAATCTVPAGTTLPPAGTLVEIKCTGTPAVLSRIEVEDDDD
jgi:hypothetical protein